MSVEGKWNITIKSPIGDQAAVLTVVPDNAGGFTGSVAGDMGTLDITGKVEGESLSWKMKTEKPMPVELTCNADVEGDTLSGKVKAGVFATMGLTGTRA